METTQLPHQMPRYRSHKVVHALKLQAVDSGPGDTTKFVPADNAFETIVASNLAESVKRCRAVEMKDPGYLVVYSDGFISWSPTEAFESGYTKVED